MQTLEQMIQEAINLGFSLEIRSVDLSDVGTSLITGNWEVTLADAGDNTVQIRKPDLQFAIAIALRAMKTTRLQPTQKVMAV